MTEQLALVPTVPPTITAVEIPLDAIRLTGIPPLETAFVESVRDFGVLEPPVVRAIGNDEYAVVGGRRRMAALKKLYAEESATIFVDAMLLTGDASPEVIDIMLNAQRGENPVSDLAAIETLLAQGAGEKEICAATGLAVPTIRKRMRLKYLVPGLRAAFNTGNLAVSVAEACAKEPVAIQEQLVAILAEKGRLLLKDVKDARSARQQQAVEALPAELFTPAPTAPPAMADTVDIDNWFAWAAERLGTIIGTAPREASPLAISQLEMARSVFADIAEAQAPGFLAADERVDVSDVVPMDLEPFDEPIVDDDFDVALEYSEPWDDAANDRAAGEYARMESEAFAALGV